MKFFSKGAKRWMNIEYYSSMKFNEWMNGFLGAIKGSKADKIIDIYISSSSSSSIMIKACVTLKHYQTMGHVAGVKFVLFQL